MAIVMCVDVATLAMKMSVVVSRRCAAFFVRTDSIGWYAAMKRTRCVDAAIALRYSIAASTA